MAERAPGHEPDAELLADWQDLGFGVAGPQRVLRLHRRNGLDSVGATDGVGTGLGQPELLHLPSLDEVFDGSGDVFDRDLGVDAVLVEQVDVVGAQPSQRALDGLGEVLGAAIEPGAGGAVVAEAELGGNHDLIADGR